MEVDWRAADLLAGIPQVSLEIGGHAFKARRPSRQPPCPSHPYGDPHGVRPGGDTMTTIISDVLEKLTLGEPQSFEHLSLFPLMAGSEVKPAYLTLVEALQGGHSRVTEVSEAGHVPELLLDNPSTHRVLLLEGDELVGARQNRVLNVTILVGPGAKLTIPVSCVERGRWSYRSREFRSEDRMMFARGRAEKMSQVARSDRASGTRRSDQGAVWSAVQAKAQALAAHAPTEAMSDVYDHASRHIGDYRAAFSAVAGQVGALLAIDGRMVGVELFDAARTLSSALGRIVGSYALDALESRSRVFAAPARSAAGSFLARVASATAEEVPAVGLGEELRVAGPGIIGEALALDGQLVHLSALVLEDDGGSMEGRGARASRMASHRRGRR